MKRSVHLIIDGVVQGVGYRKYALAKARELDIKGSVKNLSHHRQVEIYATADFDALQAFISLLRIGPQRSIVEEIQINYIDKIDFNDFQIL